MGKTGSAPRNYHFPDVRPEYVPLGLLSEGPAHGYGIYRRFKKTLGGLWRISESQMYAILKRIVTHGLAEESAPEIGEGAARRLITLSPSGRALFDAWISEPTVCSPRLLRLEFLTRLFFARRLAPDLPRKIVSSQMDAVRAQLRRLEELRGCTGGREGCAGGEIDGLAAALRITQLSGAEKWLLEDVLPTITP